MNKINYTWEIVEFPISSGVLTNALLINIISQFFSLIIKNNNFYFVLVTVQFANNQYRNIGKTNKISIQDRGKFISAILGYFNIKSDMYHELEVAAIIFKFKVIADSELIGDTSIIHQPVVPVSPRVTSFDRVEGYDLPNNMNLLRWGKVVSVHGNLLTIEYIKNNLTYVLDVEVGSNYNKVVLKLDGLEILEFTDYNLNKDYYTFSRHILNQEYYYEDGKLSAKFNTKRTTYLLSIPKDKTIITFFATVGIVLLGLAIPIVALCVTQHYYPDVVDNIPGGNTVVNTVYEIWNSFTGYFKTPVNPEGTNVPAAAAADINIPEAISRASYHLR